jgi:hypothetical protein
MGGKARPGKRGCGTRVAGGVYAECGTSPFGEPVEYFLVEPWGKADAAALGLSSIGVKVIENPETGVSHVFDIVGQEHYRNVADFIEETRVLGVSRRLPKTLDFSKLTADSRLVLLHRRAWIGYAKEHFDARRDEGLPNVCPKHCEYHIADFIQPRFCASLWWEDVEGGDLLWEADHPFGDLDQLVLPPATGGISGDHAAGLDAPIARSKRLAWQKMPCGQGYWALRAPENIEVEERRYGLAIFMSVPISRLVTVGLDAESKATRDAVAEKTTLTVDLEPE